MKISVTGYAAGITGVAAGTAGSGAARDPSSVREIARLRDDLGARIGLPHGGANGATPGHSRASLPGGPDSGKVSPAGVTIELEFG